MPEKDFKPSDGRAGDAQGGVAGAAQPPGPVGSELALRQSEEHFRILVEAVQDYAIILLDPEGRVAHWNAGARRIFGYEGVEVVGRPFAHFFTPDDVAWGEPEKDLVAATAQGHVSNERWYVRKDGKRFWANGSITALRGNGLRGFAKIVHDITHRKWMEDELRRQAGELRRQADELRRQAGELRRQAEELTDSNRRKDEFLAMLSHELRNPLAPIMNAMHVIRLEKTDNPVQQQARVMLDRQVRQISRLIDDLLEVARVIQGKVHLQKEVVELSDVLQRAVEAVSPLIESRKQKLSLSVPPGPVPLGADPVRLEQVFTNLLNNAAKYTDPGGQIWLTATLAGDREIRVKVRDTGVGISPLVLPRIFDLFTQADRSLDRSQGGMGIGLTLVRSLVEKHGGTVEAYSAGIGQGSEFTVRLPVLEDRPSTPADAAARPGPPAQALRVLVVDDNKDTADSLGMLLRTNGYEVYLAYSGLKALEAAFTYQPQIILLDIGLPEIDGWQVARRLRHEMGLKQAVLVAVTGYGTEADFAKSTEAGFDHHLVKPVDPENLQHLLSELGRKCAL